MPKLTNLKKIRSISSAKASGELPSEKLTIWIVISERSEPTKIIKETSIRFLKFISKPTQRN